VDLGQVVTVASAVVQPVAVHDDDLRSADLPGKQVMAIHLTRLEHLLGPAGDHEPPALEQQLIEGVEVSHPSAAIEPVHPEPHPHAGNGDGHRQLIKTGRLAPVADTATL
jgi:hypothetical protein